MVVVVVVLIAAPATTVRDEQRSVRCTVRDACFVAVASIVAVGMVMAASILTAMRPVHPSRVHPTMCAVVAAPTSERGGHEGDRGSVSSTKYVVVRIVGFSCHLVT